MKKCPSGWCLITDCECISKLTCWIGSPLLLLMRLYWGWEFFIAGKGKLTDPAKVASFFQSLNIPMPMVNAYLVGSIECFGGLLLLVGLASRVVSIPLTLVMVTAYMTAHVEYVKTIFSNPQGFISQDPFLFLLTTLLVLSFGPGCFSLDHLICRKCCKSEGASGSACCS